MNKQQIKKNNKKNQTTKEINTKVRKDKHLNLKKLTPVVNLFFLLLFIATALYYMPVLNKNEVFYYKNNKNLTSLYKKSNT